MLIVQSRRKKRETIVKEFGDVEIIDVTSRGPELTNVNPVGMVKL